MKIGLITFHCAYNFGSVLQTWALKRTLEEMGNEVQVIDYRGKDFKQYRLMPISRPSRVCSNIVHFSKNLERRNQFEAFIHDRLNLTKKYTTFNEWRMKYDLPGQFDCFVCGSDQIWNMDCTHGPVGPYFLNFAGDKPRIAYAPSLSHIAFEKENFTDAMRNQVAKWLEKFTAVSVRERITAPLFQELCPIKIEACVDPTLLLSRDDYHEVAREVSIDPDAVFVYMLEENPGLISYADDLAKKLKRTVYYISRNSIEFSVSSHNLYGIGPSDFLGLIATCGCVITNSFHATVFSLQFGTPFQTFVTKNSGSRMVELLGLLGLSEHLTDGSVLQEPDGVSLTDAGQRIDAIRSDSLAFLESALCKANDYNV